MKKTFKLTKNVQIEINPIGRKNKKCHILIIRNIINGQKIIVYIYDWMDDEILKQVFVSLNTKI